MKKYLLFLAFLIATMAPLKAFLYYTNYTEDQIIHVTYQVYYKASDNSSWESWMETTTLLPGESLWLDDNHWWEFWSLWEESEPFYSGEGGGGGGDGGVSFTPSTTNVQVGGTIDFHVWANNNAGLSLIGLESCNSAGVPVENRGEIAVGGTSAENVFTVDFDTPGTYYFDSYFWSGDHSQLSRSSVTSVTVTGEEDKFDGPASETYREAGPLYYSFEGETLDRTALEARIAANKGWVGLTRSQKLLLNEGCVGLVKIMMRKRIWANGEITVLPAKVKYPEDNPVAQWGEVKAFLTMADLNGWSCPAGYTNVIYAKAGPWKNGIAPTPISGGTSNEVPLDSVENVNITSQATGNNYITLVGTQWIGMNQGVSAAHPVSEQVGNVLPTEPSAMPGQGLIFIARHIPNDW